jgi:hypothetical protein
MPTDGSDVQNGTARSRLDPIAVTSLASGVLAALTLPLLYPIPSTLFAILGVASGVVGVIRSRSTGSPLALSIVSLVLSLVVITVVVLSVVFDQGGSSGSGQML